MLSYVELTVVYPFFLLSAFLFICLFILPYRVNMYNLISSELPVKIDSID